MDRRNPRLLRLRVVTTVGAIAPVILVLAGAVRLASEPHIETDCWVLPNARVLRTPADHCPLRNDDQLVGLQRGDRRIPASEPSVLLSLAAVHRDAEFLVRRSGEVVQVPLSLREVSVGERGRRVLIAAMVAGVLLVIPMIVLWSSGARAAVPIAWGYGLAATVSAVAVAGQHSAWLSRVALLALTAAPAVIVHAALLFPHERRIVDEAPGILKAPYLSLAFLLPSGWFAIDRDPLLWPTFMVVLQALTAGAWALLFLSCFFAIRESGSSLERTRARLLCFGSVLIPLIPTGLVAREAGFSPSLATGYIWSAAMALPITIGLAITQYNLFDVVWDARRWVGRIVYLGAAAAAVSLAIRFGLASGESTPTLSDIFLLALAALLGVEIVRRRIIGIIEAMMLPKLRQFREQRSKFGERARTLVDEDALAAHLAAGTREAVDTRSGAVFLEHDGVFRLAAAFGAAPPGESWFAGAAAGTLRGEAIRHLAKEEFLGEPDFDRLLSAGVEAVLEINGRNRRLGLLLLGTRSNRVPYSGIELDHVLMLAGSTGIALDTLRTASEFAAVERHAAAGRVAVVLAHDLGKELDWIKRLGSRLPARLPDRGRVERDSELIQDLAGSVVEALQEFVEQATRAAADARTSTLDEIAMLAIRQVERLHGGERVHLRLDPWVRTQRIHPAIARVTANLLDNALRASKPLQLVQLRIDATPAFARIRVDDEGCGMDEELQVRAFQPGCSTRKGEGGLGVGLTAAREIVNALGGSIELESEPGEGTRVTLSVPLTTGDGT